MLWMHSWLDEVKIKYSLPGLIKGDNHGVIALSKNTKDHSKVKHVDIQHHYIHELLSSKICTRQLLAHLKLTFAIHRGASAAGT